MRLIPDPEAEGWFAGLAGKPGDFDWDAGNVEKLTKHRVTCADVEALVAAEVVVFAGRIIEPMHAEARWLALGRDASGRGLALIFTRRGEALRPISCRPLRRGERRLYAEATGEG